jgi:hypothetical protein
MFMIFPARLLPRGLRQIGAAVKAASLEQAEAARMARLATAKAKMTPAFSLALDALRFLAALCVFFDHLSSAPFTEHVIPPRLGAYGDIAVTLFFVLSGFVIAHVVARRERDPETYAIARLSRRLAQSILLCRAKGAVEAG